MNILLDGFVCPSCFNTYDVNKGEIKNDAFTYDEVHNELYCNSCGLVVKDSSLTPIKLLEYFKIRDKIYKSTKIYEDRPKEEFVDFYEYLLQIKQRRIEIEKAAAEKRAKKRANRKNNKKTKKKKKKKK